MSDFNTAIAYVLRNEKGFIDNAYDKGKSTNFGISFRFLKSLPADSLKKYGFYGDITDQTIRDLTLDQATRLYHDEFWINAPFEKILNQDHCSYIFDMSISMGIAPAVKCVQRAVWAVMKRRDLVDDGILGESTLRAMELCGFIIFPAMRSERASYYRLTVQNDSDDKEFINGWLNRAYESQ
jgi:lysozyme family protein